MPRASRSKSQPDADALVSAAVAALDQEKAIARSTVGPPSVRETVLEVLRRRGYEVTAKVVRVPVAEQLEVALREGSYLAMKALGTYVRGATAVEARKAALSLAEAGRAHLALRTDSETLVPATTDIVVDKELEAATKRVADLGKVLQKAARKKNGAGVLRADVREALDSVLTHRSRNGSRRMEPGSELPCVLRAVDSARDVAVGLSFVPKVVALLAPELAPEAAKKALLEAASQGLLELRPEGGLGRLSDAEREACPRGPQGTHLSWARRIEVEA
jgi:hypothetical protein